MPETWDEVVEILPELQRFGMNYNTPLSSGSGTKGYLVTAPYLFNHGAPLYADNGFATGLGSDEAIEAIQFMAESFTIYGMPLETASFYDSFRYGSLPIGVSNYETYLKLMTAAPELNGLWDIDPYPATVLEDGTELRYATGSAQASIMFANTESPERAWAFMKWWMSTETQMDFQQQLILNYGMDYLWNSANVEAFATSPIPDEHKAVILEQWQWLQEPLKLPGSYMQERELSNVWNRIVFDGVNPRVAIDSAVITINREIARKMEEFGYLENGGGGQGVQDSDHRNRPKVDGRGKVTKWSSRPSSPVVRSVAGVPTERERATLRSGARLADSAVLLALPRVDEQRGQRLRLLVAVRAALHHLHSRAGAAGGRALLHLLRHHPVADLHRPAKLHSPADAGRHLHAVRAAQHHQVCGDRGAGWLRRSRSCWPGCWPSCPSCRARSWRSSCIPPR